MIPCVWYKCASKVGRRVQQCTLSDCSMVVCSWLWFYTQWFEIKSTMYTPLHLHHFRYTTSVLECSIMRCLYSTFMSFRCWGPFWLMCKGSDGRYEVLPIGLWNMECFFRQCKLSSSCTTVQLLILGSFDLFSNCCSQNLFIQSSSVVNCLPSHTQRNMSVLFLFCPLFWHYLCGNLRQKKHFLRLFCSISWFLLHHYPKA